MAKLNEDLARQARISVEKWRQGFKVNNDQYHRMHDFVLGKQWDDDEEDMLKTYQKVPLQFNKLATLVNTLLGEQQQNTPQLEVVPLSNCDEETIEIRQIVVKDIMLSTDAKTVYQVAAAQAFVGGFGAFVVDTEYSHDKSFDLDIRYRYLKDATRAYWDLGAEDINKTDGMFCGYLSRMSRKKFKEEYGEEVENKILKKSGAMQSEQEIALAVDPQLKDDSFSWSDEESITIMNHFVRTLEDDRLFKLSNGNILNEQEMEELVESSREHAQQMMQMQQMQSMMAPYMDQGMQPGMNQGMQSMQGQMPMMGNDDIETLYMDGEPVRIVDERKSKRSKMMGYKIAGDYILDEGEFPSEDLPVIFVDQNSYYDKNGKQVCRPFVTDAIDAQRYLNYLGTQSAYILKMSRYDQFIGSKQNARSNDTAEIWRNPAKVQGMLAYDETPSGAKPEQLRPPELSASLGLQYQRAMEDLYTSTGLYPTRIGQEGNEISGAAIDARTRQGSYTTYVAFNSINRAISAGGKIVNQMVPRVYDTERVMNLLTPDEGRQTIVINQSMDEYGERVKNDLRKGTFEVRLQAGPSYEGQKAQALESLNLVIQSNPALFPMFADLYAENLPLVNTIEIKNRLKTLVPPEILQAGKTGKMPDKAAQPNPQDQAALAEIQFKQEQIEIEKQKLQLQMQEQQMKLEQVQMELQMKALEMAGEVESAKLRYMAESDRTRSQNAIAHADNLTKILTHKGMETQKNGT